MSKLMDAVLEFEDVMRETIKEHDEKHAQETAKLRAEVESLNRYFAAGVKLTGEKHELEDANAKLREGIAFLEQQFTAANRVHFENRQRIEVKNYELTKENEALRAENVRMRNACDAFSGECADAERYAAEYFRALAVVHERDANDERDLPTILRALYAQMDGLRIENNAQDAAADLHIASLRAELGEMREEYVNRGRILHDFAKREHEHQKLIAELEKQIGHMEKVLKEFFPAPIIPEFWETDPKSIPQGEWVLRSNEALRNRIVEIRRARDILRDEVTEAHRRCKKLEDMLPILRDEAAKAQENAIRFRTERDEALAELLKAEQTAADWKMGYRHLHSRIAEMRASLLRIRDGSGNPFAMALAGGAIAIDDQEASKPCPKE